MPVTPNPLERLLFLRLNRAPGPFLDLFGAAGLRAVTAGLELGVFEALADRRSGAADLARELDADERALTALLDFLAELGYVTESDGLYGNSRMTTKWLRADSPTSVADWLSFWDRLVLPFWNEEMTAVIRTGAPSRTIYEWFDEEPERWTLAQRGFRAVATLTADEVVRKVDVPAYADRLLDVGGGHGLFSVEFCLANPGLRATVFDSEPALSAARETVEGAGSDVADRVGLAAGDYWADGLGDGYDLALLFNVIHSHSPAENTTLLRRTRDALEPGGRVVLMDQFEDSAPTPIAETALQFVGLTYLVTLGGRIYPFADVSEWLADAGFVDVERIGLRSAPGASLVVGTVPF